MAFISYEINQMSGKPAVHYTVLRLDLNDEVVMSTCTPHAAILWVQENPFDPAKMTAVYVLPQIEATPSPIRVVTPRRCRQNWQNAAKSVVPGTFKSGRMRVSRILEPKHQRPRDPLRTLTKTQR